MRVDLSLYAKDLPNVAGAFKGTSDPFAVITHVATSPGAAPEVLGKTEVIKNALSPQWTKLISFDYELGTPMKLIVSVFDEVQKGDNKSMGSAVFDVGSILGARGNTKAKKLKNGGTLFAHVDKSEGSGVLRFQMQAEKLTNTEGFMRKSDPFFELSKRVDAAGAQTWDNVFRSNPVMNNLSPTWQPVAVDLSTLCKGNLDLPILISVYDHEKSGDHELMGQYETTVNGMLNAAVNQSPMKLTKKGKETGSLIISRATAEGVQGAAASSAAAGGGEENRATGGGAQGSATFLDYVSGGCELHLAVAIDFTGSNGNPRDPGTLHHWDNNSDNDYEKAMKSIVSILEKYDSDKSFPVYGFGAKYDGVVQHCFQCGPTEEVKGVQGVLDAYHQVFASGLIMSGPTVFTEVIQTAAARAQSAFDQAQSEGDGHKQVYSILLILTDGAVSDVEETVACLEQASSTPLSIVIVGVGDADFSSMQFLDDVAASNGTRDIAQFVEFNKHSKRSVDLTSATLKEIPRQLETYFQSQGVKPLDRFVPSEDEIAVEPEEEEIDLSLDINEDEIVVAGGGNYSGNW